MINKRQKCISVVGMYRVVVVVVLVDLVCGQLKGEHVCREEVSRKINTTEYYLRNQTIRHYEWCMNVPPRCSFYSTRLVNTSKIVEKQVVDLVEKCCSGYIEDNDKSTCRPVCPDCLNGNCTDGKCHCFPGYKGENCKIECGESEWGVNCTKNCSCNGDRCNSKNGLCLCGNGKTGDNCQLPCQPGHYGPNCILQCHCASQSCDPATGQCPSTTSQAPPLSTIPFTNNGRLDLSTFHVITTTQETDVLLVGSQEGKDKKQEVEELAVGDGVLSKAKRKVEHEDDDSLSQGQGQGQGQGNQLMNGVGVATAISVAVIVVAGVIVAANRLKKERRDVKERVSTVAVYTHSIFHTPLPDPPIVENVVEESRIETHVVCSLNFPTLPTQKEPKDFSIASTLDKKNYLYDHPPSTGSYRAASIPEPPDIEGNLSRFEPVYDEIPSGTLPTPITEPPPYKSTSLYMNTCGKTRF